MVRKAGKDPGFSVEFVTPPVYAVGALPAECYGGQGR